MNIPQTTAHNFRMPCNSVGDKLQLLTSWAELYFVLIYPRISLEGRTSCHFRTVNILSISQARGLDAKNVYKLTFLIFASMLESSNALYVSLKKNCR